MDEKILSILQDIQKHLEKHDARFDSLDSRMDNLEDKVDKLEATIKEEIKLTGHELHIEIQTVYENVEGLRDDLNTMEILTTKNAFDIAKLKSVR